MIGKTPEQLAYVVDSFFAMIHPVFPIGEISDKYHCLWPQDLTSTSWQSPKGPCTNRYPLKGITLLTSYYSFNAWRSCYPIGMKLSSIIERNIAKQNNAYIS